MRFSKSALKIGDGRVTSVRQCGDYDEFLLSSGGAFYPVRRDKGKKTFVKGGVVSYAGECVYVRGKLLEKRNGGFNYVS